MFSAMALMYAILTLAKVTATFFQGLMQTSEIL
jgi:hypothetical protein